MYDNPQLDDALAAFTDRLRAGEEIQAPPDLEELASVVRQLHMLLPPDAHAGQAFREQLTLRLNREWASQHKRRAITWRTNRMMQLAALAAVITVILLALVLFSSTRDDSLVEGTAVGSTAGAAIIIVVLIGIGLVIVWFSRQRKL